MHPLQPGPHAATHPTHRGQRSMSRYCHKTLRTAARQMPHAEHTPLRARLLRQAMARNGKTFAQLTTSELLALNAQITQQLEHHHAS